MRKQRKMNGNIGSLATLLAVLAGPLAACSDFPRDPEDTLRQAQERGSLRVGVIVAPPWVGYDAGEATGPEARLAAEFASQLGVRVDWMRGSADTLLVALEAFELDLVLGGLTEASPWRDRVGMTHPYYVSHAVVAIPADAAVPASLEGLSVAVKPGSGLREALQERGARIEVRESLAGAEGAVATDRWRIDALGLRPLPDVLARTRHVLAVPPGENALLLELETFLRNRAPAARVREQLIAAEVP